ncbi:hypothetical protein PTE30175_02749 [Pandoraea terrae]|uniref:DUF1653 domain-containing protein n=1 Tax=Pandoraea terrae TaxID=1537710 RepID=A0A5E4VTX9_9BURK|nr:hypothetical protein PTE30175_02749 [Pandoraea terrae]
MSNVESRYDSTDSKFAMDPARVQAPGNPHLVVQRTPIIERGIDVTQTPSAAEAIEAFRAGVYRHYKGNFYLALGLARADETQETVVVYTRLYPRDGLPMSTRLLSIWNDTVETGAGQVPRFEYVGHTTPEG